MTATLRPHVHALSAHPLDCHVYLLDGGDELALVDAGAGLDPDGLLEDVRELGYEPRRIRKLLLTHGHGDHAAGAAALGRRLPGLEILAAPAAREWLETGDEEALSVAPARRAGIYPPEFRLEPCTVEGQLVAGEDVRVGALRLEVIDTPGHCRGHVSLLLAHGGHRDLFAGDAIFAGGRVALQPIHDCDIGDTTRTLRRLREVPLDGLMAGHGEVVLAGADAHVERANRALDQLLLPEPLNTPEAGA